MGTFLIQCDEHTNEPLLLDFIFAIRQAVDYQNWWYNGSNAFNIIHSDTVFNDQIVPIGTVEFVVSFLQRHYNITPKPRNVPECLFEYAKREIKNNEMIINKPNYIKSNDIIKHPDNGNNLKQWDRNFQASEIINDIEEEWRGFVFEGKLLDIRRYSGTIEKYPDINLVREMINVFEKSYKVPAYTIDVGISKTRGTFLLEMHDFFSCGLYGFDRNDLLPFMFSKTFNYIKTIDNSIKVI